jgi:hypothetical protein
MLVAEAQRALDKKIHLNLKIQFWKFITSNLGGNAPWKNPMHYLVFLNFRTQAGLAGQCPATIQL